ncbi:MAG TPA: proton-conducting transporter membrane subunit [Streptosporangiaceae bacterium]|nr:proton-conducting transporter membrane subunit [Streptosporangiaceae bacterium]
MTGAGMIFAAGLAALVLAAAADLTVSQRRGWQRGLPYVIASAGAACLGGAGGAVLAGHAVRLPVAGWLGQGTAPIAADHLSGLFLLIAFGAAFGVLLAFAAWAAASPRPVTSARLAASAQPAARRGLGASTALALGSVAVFLTAQDAFTAVLSWELLTVAFYLLAGFDRGLPGRPSGALVTLAFGKISGAALLVGLLLLAVRSGSLSLGSLAVVPHGATRSAAQALLLMAFAIKVGLVPFQVWLPRGYAAAPGPARAIMGGVAVNAGFYGMWRTLALLGPPPAWLTGLLLVLASLTALLGIAHAAVQPRLQRVIAYSSVENSGLITAGYGIALVGAAIGDDRLVAVGLLAGTLQIIAHAAAKSLLFSSSAIVAGEGQDLLDALRGSARRRPWGSAGLAIGSLTLAGLPLTIGFASEWFLLEAMMQQFRVHALDYRLLLAGAGAAVALTAGFAGVTFVRIIGLVVLGPPAADAQEAWDDRVAGDARVAGDGREGRAWDGGWLGRTGIAVLSACCLLMTAALPLLIRVIATGLSPVVAASVTNQARQSPLVLGPVFRGFSVLSPTWLWMIMPLLALAVLAFTRLAAGTRMTQVRRVPVWRSATAGVEGADSYTAGGFANPTRRVLATVLHSRSQVVPHLAPPSAQFTSGSSGELQDEISAPPAPGPTHRYSSDVIEVVEAYLYRPVLTFILRMVGAVKRLQSGRLDAYMAYMLIALIAILAAVTALD